MISIMKLRTWTRQLGGGLTVALVTGLTGCSGDSASRAAHAEIVRQILEPHALTVRYEAGIYLVIRMTPPKKTAEPVMRIRKPPIENITV